MTIRIPHSWLCMLLLLAPTPCMRAETIDWTMGKAIDCPLQQSLPSKVLTRTVLFPGTISECPSFWSDEQLYVKIIRNTVVLELRDPLFTATLQLYDDRGNLYLLNVRAAGAGDSIDELLMLRPKTDESAPGALAQTVVDSDGQISDMMAAMLAGVARSDVVRTPVTRVEQGHLRSGRVLLRDSVCTLELVTQFQGPRLRGYECLLRSRSQQPMHLDEQRLWFDGALAVYASSHVLPVVHGMQVDLAKDQAITLFYVVGQP